MHIWTGKCRMPIGACSEFRDKECPKFCYYNTVEIKKSSLVDKIRNMKNNGYSIKFARTIHGTMYINVKKESFDLIQYVPKEESEEAILTCLDNLEKEIIKREQALNYLAKTFKKSMEDHECQPKNTAYLKTC